MNLYIEKLYAEGIRAATEGRFDLVKTLAAQLDTLGAEKARVLYLKGVSAYYQSDFQMAREFITATIKTAPKNGSSYSLRAILNSRLGDYESAREDFLAALKYSSDDTNLVFNYGLFEQERGNLETALQIYRGLVEKNKIYIPALNNYTLLLLAAGKHDLAAELFEKLVREKRLPNEVTNLYADVLRQAGNLEEAKKQYVRYLQFYPEDFQASYNLGCVELQLLNHETAHIIFKKLYKKTGSKLALWAKSFSVIPIVYKNSHEVENSRENLECELNFLRDCVLKQKSDDWPEVVGSHQPFYLAYQDVSNIDLLRTYGEICDSAMSNLPVQETLKDRRRAIRSEPIALFVVSNQVKNYSVWNAITKGFLLNIDKGKLKVVVLNIGDLNDSVLKTLPDHLHILDSSGSTSQIRRRILDLSPDVIVYPEIGMHPTATQLATVRLAPLQVAMWGHPETTGIKTIDYYISASLFETANSGAHYTEKLIPLSNLGCYLEEPGISPEPNLPKELFAFKPNKLVLCPSAPKNFCQSMIIYLQRLRSKEKT